jgi:outer membrane protein assembly factor BamB
MATIFISYRRADAQGEARLLYRDLVERFGKTAVFMDVTGIAKGRDFRVALNEQLAHCGVALVVIGDAWLATEEDGKRRIDDEQDFVRLEVATTLRKAEIPVIPVLVGGATMPSAAALPKDIQDLVFRDGVELTHARWDSDVAELIKAIEPYMAAASPESTPPAVTVQPPSAPTGTPQRRVAPWRGVMAVGGLALLAVVGTVTYLALQRPSPAPVVASGPIVVSTGAGGVLTAADRATDKLLWRQPGRYRCVDAYDGQRALVLDEKGVQLIGRDGKAARSLELADAQWVTRATRFGDDALLLTSANKKWVKAVDWTGTERWSSDGFHSPGVAIRVKGALLLADGTAKLKVLDQHGKVTREIPVSRWAMSLARSPEGGVVVCVSGGVEKVRPDGAVEWTRDGMGRVSSVQALSNGEFLIADPDNKRLLKLNARGETIWEHAADPDVNCAVELQ